MSIALLYVSVLDNGHLLLMYSSYLSKIYLLQQLSFGQVGTLSQLLFCVDGNENEYYLLQYGHKYCTCTTFVPNA